MRADKDEKQFGIIDQGALGSVEPELWKDFDEWYSTGADFDFFPSVNISAPIAITDKYSRAQADGRIRDNDLQDWVSYK